MKLYPNFHEEGHITWEVNPEDGTVPVICDSLADAANYLNGLAQNFCKNKKVFDAIRKCRPEVVKTIFRDGWECALESCDVRPESGAMANAFHKWLDRIEGAFK